jgi:hypothetical protein
MPEKPIPASIRDDRWETSQVEIKLKSNALCTPKVAIPPLDIVPCHPKSLL